MSSSSLERNKGLLLRVGLRHERLRGQGQRGHVRGRGPWKRPEGNRGSSKGKEIHTTLITYLIHSSPSYPLTCGEMVHGKVYQLAKISMEVRISIPGS